MTPFVKYEVDNILMEGRLHEEDLCGPGKIVGSHIHPAWDKSGKDGDAVNNNSMSFHRDQDLVPPPCCPWPPGHLRKVEY